MSEWGGGGSGPSKGACSKKFVLLVAIPTLLYFLLKKPKEVKD